MSEQDRTPVLIALGGTGQSVLAAYLRLAQMAGFPPARFYVVDSDTKGLLGKAVTRLSGAVEGLADGGEVPRRWMVDPFPASDAERKTFGALFGSLVGTRRRLFDVLFSDEAEQTPIRTGMYGRPAIGATCIRYKFLQGDDDLEELKAGLRGGSKRVVLVGSCFGGTGSGGVPMLAAEFARLAGEPGYDLKVDAVVFLPWFRLVVGDTVLRRDQRTLHEHLNRNFEPNAAAGIHYFKKDLREHVESLVLLGMPDPGRTTRESDEANQRETVHPLNLLAAVLIQNRFAGELAIGHGIYGYWIDPETGIKDLRLARRPGNGALTLQQIAHRTSLAEDWLGILGQFFARYTRLPKSFRPQLIQLALEKIGGPTGNLDQVATEVSKAFERRRDFCGEGLRWLREMAEADRQLLPLADEDLRIRHDDYDAVTAEPLREIEAWSRDDRNAARLQPQHLASPESFSDRTSELFLSHLIARFAL